MGSIYLKEIVSIPPLQVKGEGLGSLQRQRWGRCAWKAIGLQGMQCTHPARGRGDRLLGVGMEPKGSSPLRRVRGVRLGSTQLWGRVREWGASSAALWDIRVERESSTWGF